ncbi:hypothetical protein [Argonema galeatum]|uniref:hypothetical protein n=1 Tax=Argonema galeatum TaxID=2942762 RepID=UPI0020117826|nr:hypothetical protein [Argonema galeatum]MCL1466763.1 hypothetical protein [Argonema galeatum A003/A1]
MKPEYLDKWFPLEQQHNYVSRLFKQAGLTRRRAECFVRLWAYLLLKQQHERGKRLVQPLTQLEVPQGSVSCTHREAAELFYAHKERGSDRAAGMMIDQLAAIGLIEKEFDGQTICIEIRPLPSLKPPEPVQIEIDNFNAETDAVPVANLMAHHYNRLAKDSSTTPHKLVKVLRNWAGQYSTGMRVLRRCDNQNPVGIYILYPTASESEANFFQPPSKTRFITSDTQTDSFKMAHQGDLDCTCVYLRAWIIDNPYIQQATVCQFVEDAQKTLVQMQADFPNLCDLHTVSLNPVYEEMRQAMGFQKTYQDTQRTIHWVYLPMKRFLALDMKQALSSINFGTISEV